MKINRLPILTLIFFLIGSIGLYGSGCYSTTSNNGDPWSNAFGGIEYGVISSCTAVSYTTYASTQYFQFDGVTGRSYTFSVSGGSGWSTAAIQYWQYNGSSWVYIDGSTTGSLTVTSNITSSPGNGWNLIVAFNGTGCSNNGGPAWTGTSATLTYICSPSTAPSITAPSNISVYNSPNNSCGAAETFGAPTGSSACSGAWSGNFNLAPSSGVLSSVAGNLKLWCKGDAGIFQDASSNVATWYDISGSGNYFYQATNTYRPSYTSSSASFNGYPVLTFTTGEFSQLVTSLDGGANSAYTMFVVDRLNGGTNARMVSSASTNWLFGNWSGGEEKCYCNGWISSSASGSPAADALPHMYELTSNSSVTNGTNFYDYGVLQATGTGSNAGGPNGPGQIQLNGYEGFNENSSGDVAEIIYYNTILSTAQRQIIEGYLAYKYNLPCPMASAQAYQTYTASTTVGFLGADLGSDRATTTATAGLSTYPGPSSLSITNPSNCAGNSTTTLSVANGMSPAGSCLTTGVGSGDYLNVGVSGSQTSSNVTLGSTWTIESWVKFPLPANGNWNTLFRGINYHPIIVERTQGATNAGLIIGCYQGGFYPATAPYGVNGTTIAGISSLVQGVDISALSTGWHHVAATGSGNTESFYIDGVFIGKTAIQVGYTATDNLIAIGNYQGGGQDAGTMDEVKIYNVALSQNAISNTMTQVSTASTDPNWNSLVAYYKMDASPVPNSATGSAACSSCTGTVQSSATAGSTATAYYTYNWSGPGSPTFSPAASGTAETVTLSNPTAANSGTYSVYASANSCNSGTVTGAITIYAPSVAGTPSVSSVNFCESNNTFSPAVTISGNTGTVYWAFRTNTGGAGTQNPNPLTNTSSWVSGPSSGTCCFPIETSPTDGGANGIYYMVQNGVCPATAISAVIPIQNSYTVTPTLAVSSGTSSTAYSYCSGSPPSSITITASFSSVPSTYGSILWYEGTCGSGTLMGTTALSGTTAVSSYNFNVTSAYYPAAGATQNYYAEYAPPSPTGEGCGNLCSNAITVTDISSPNVSISGTTSVCQGSTAPTITFTNFSTAAVTVSYTLNGAAQTPINIAASSTATTTQSTSTTNTYTYALTSVQYQTGTTCPTSLSGTAVVTVKAQPSSAALSDNYATNGCGGGHTVTVTITGGTSPYSFSINGTPYTNQTSPYVKNPVTNTSYTLSGVTDANGCPAATISNSPYTPAASTLSTGDNYTCTIGSGATQVFFDHSGNLMAQVTAGSTALGSTAVTTTIDGSVQEFGPTHQQHYLQRHFLITPTTSATANVCLFIADAEANALNTASSGDQHGSPQFYGTFPAASSSASGFQAATAIMKYDGGSQTPGSHSSEQVISGVTATHNPTINGNTYNAVWELCYNVGGFSGFYIYAANSTGDPLPVTLVSFTAEAVNNQYIELDWATASEVNNSGFQIERSLDGVSYQSIGWVDGHGNSEVTNDYQYSDLTAIPGIVYYYRLKQVDQDGNFAYSQIASAELTGDKGFTLTGLYPNPATNEVSVGVISNINTTATITMTDMLGRTILHDDWGLSIGYNTNVYDLANIASGTYIVTISSGTATSIKHLTIAK